MAPSAKELPHEVQNLATVCCFAMGAAAPHEAQNLEPSGMAALHEVQTWPPWFELSAKSTLPCTTG